MSVIPAKAGIQMREAQRLPWTPATAGGYQYWSTT